jgi:uncharacterized membrane protein YeiH
MHDFVFWLDLMGVAVFAATGALTASRKQLDIVGFALLAAFTGIGGGTLRDLLIGRLPVFWVAQPVYLAVTTLVAVLVFFTAHRLESRFRVLLWLDAMGLSLYCALGAETALTWGTPASVAVLMGTMTATFGGLIRDIVCAEVPLALRREIYVTAAALGASVFVGLSALGVGADAALIAAAAACFATRGLALWRGWSLPPYRRRPGRDYPPGGAG